jgi:hypothetical protein
MHMLAGGRGTFTRARLTGITAVMAGEDSTAAMLLLALKRRQLRETARRSGAGVGALQANFFVGRLTDYIFAFGCPDTAYDLGIVG